VQKVLEGANIKLSSVVTDVMGVSARAMLEGLIAGQKDVQALAELAKGRLRTKRKELEAALTGWVGSHHRFLLAQQLAHIDFLDEQIEQLSQEIGAQVERMSQPPAASGSGPDPQQGSGQVEPSHLSWTEGVTTLDTMPGVDTRAAQGMLAEMGLNMAQFPTPDDLTAWAGLAPGNNESGGKRFSARTCKGNQPLRSLMIQVAWAAVRTKGTFLKARYHRLAARRGKKRAIVAIARSMLVSAWPMLKHQQPYRELGQDFYDQRRKETKVTYLTKQLSKLGFAVTLDPLPATA
jgi:transposase